MGLILKLIALNVIVFGGLWLRRECRIAIPVDDQGNPIPTPMVTRESGER